MAPWTFSISRLLPTSLGDLLSNNGKVQSVHPESLFLLYDAARTPDLLEELTASRQSRKRAWENLQEIRWVIKDTTGIDLPPPRKTIDAEGSLIVDAVRKAVRERQGALTDLIRAIRAFQNADQHPLNKQESGYAQVLHKLHGAIDRAERLVQ